MHLSRRTRASKAATAFTRRTYLCRGFPFTTSPNRHRRSVRSVFTSFVSFVSSRPMQFTRRRHDRSEFKICDSINQIESIHRDRRVRCDEYDTRKRPPRASVRPSARPSLSNERKPIVQCAPRARMDGWKTRVRRQMQNGIFVTSYKPENGIGTHF